MKAIAFTAAVCKQMYQGDQFGRKWPDTCVIDQKERHDLDETYDPSKTVPNSLLAITKLVSRQVRKLREYQDNLPAGAVSVDQYFTTSCAEDGKASQLSDKPFRFLEYMEHVTKLWEKDGDDFKYPANQVQHHLDDLLIYRATLMHMIISQAADNSHILSNPNYHKLIPVI
ncbi:Ff.00g108020.m01.CDS01 [Fusarium sp. VM40]|nr:Ff.00g108020.m01.CDS01 [Fusarium sp. VM40]